MATQIQPHPPTQGVVPRFRDRLSRWGHRCRGAIAATAGGTLMLLGSLGALPAIALTDEEFGKRLELVPVFTVLREDGRPVVVFPNRDAEPNPADARVLSFLDPDDVQKFMEALRERNSEEAEKTSILVSSIGEVYQWGQDNPNGPKIEYFPIVDQLPEALEIARAANPELNINRFPGIPLFVATDGAGEGYLTLEENGRKVVPFFFRLEDLKSTLETFRQGANGSILDDVKVEVATLSQVLSILRSSDAGESDLVDRIRLIPSREALEYVETLRQGQEAATPTPAPSPSGAGALTP